MNSKTILRCGGVLLALFAAAVVGCAAGDDAAETAYTDARVEVGERSVTITGPGGSHEYSSVAIVPREEAHGAGQDDLFAGDNQCCRSCICREGSGCICTDCHDC